MTDHTDSIGVSAIVRMRRSSGSFWEEGDIGMVIGQASNGPDRYTVMFPGNPFAYSPHVRDMEVVQGVALGQWWRRRPREADGHA